MADMESLKNNGHSTMLVRVFQKLKQKIDTKVDKETGKGLSSEDYTSSEKTKLNGIATGAEVNQNAFSNVTIGSTTIAADSKTDTLTLVAGSNVSLTPDATNDKITISANDTTNAFYGTCSTAAATATKEVTLSSAVGWNLVAGVVIGVKFSNSNTASSVKLDVNGSGAKSIYFGNAVYAGTSVQITGWKDYIIYYMYDGTNWMFLNNSYNFTDSNNYVTQTATTTSADYEVLFSNTADNTTRNEAARKNSNLTFNPSTGNLQVPQLNGATIGSSPKFTDTYNVLQTLGRVSSPNTQYGDGKIRYIIVSSSMTTDKPAPGDGHLIDIAWDNNNGYDTQMYIGNANRCEFWLRGQSAGTWGEWNRVGVFSSAPTTNQVVIADGTYGKIKTSGYTIAKSVPSDAKFTDTTYSNATQSAAGLMSASDKAKLDKMYTVVTTEAELTSALATANNNILVANSFALTKTIAITQNNTNLTFNKNAVFDMSGKNFAFITVGTANTKPTYVTINNPKAQGNKTSGSIGINLLGMGFGGSINSPTLQSFDVGIKTNSFDCAQLISLYEPVIQGCNIGIDDSLGGLQAVRIYGGRIEGNTNWGVKIGSPNANFMGTVIEGNGTNLSNGGEVYFTNVSTNRSSAVFVNCYFETLSTTAGNVITANSNWLGNVSLTNCEIYNLSIPVFSYTGSDTKERAINITGGNVKGTVMLNVPNVGNSTSIFISNVLYDDSTNAIDANIGANANKFISGKNVSTTSIVRGKSFMAGNTKDGVKSAENVYSKILQIDTPSGNNNFIRLTQSASNPWADTSVGILKGSLHYNSATNKWYQRITSKGTIDAEANWSPLILATTPHTEISTSGSGNSLYFSMPDKSQWVGKKLCICAWRTNESDVNMNPPKFMWEFYVPTNWGASSDDFDVYSAYRGAMATLHDTYITVHLDYSNNRISLQDEGFYARNLNGTNFYLYWYHSLMTYKLVIL